MSASARKLYLAAVLCTALLCATVLAQADRAEITVDLPTYMADLRHWSAALAQLRTHPEHAAELRRSIPARMEVQFSGEGFAVSNSWLLEALIRWEKEPAERTTLEQDVESRLRLQLAQAEVLGKPAAPPSATARAQLKAVLSQREFRFVQPPSWWDLLLARVQRWIARRLQKLLSRVRVGQRVADVISWVILAAAFLALTFLLLQHLRRVPRGMTRLELQGRAPATRTWSAWAQAALAAFSEQRSRDVVHYAYWAAVFRLEHMGVWRLDAARTPREYLGLLPRDSEYHMLMSSLTRSFEMAWYGYRPVTGEDAQSALNQLESLGCKLQSTAATASY